MNWISWLCPGMNLKRWLLLFSGGVLCCAFSLALLFNDQTMGFVEEMLFRMSYMTTGPLQQRPHDPGRHRRNRGGTHHHVLRDAAHRALRH